MRTQYTLENFLRLHEDKAIDFELRVLSHGRYTFCIRPTNGDGETWRFHVNGNALEYIYPSTTEEEQTLLSRIKELEAKVRDLEEFQRDYETRQLEQTERS